MRKIFLNLGCGLMALFCLTLILNIGWAFGMVDTKVPVALMTVSMLSGSLLILLFFQHDEISKKMAKGPTFSPRFFGLVRLAVSAIGLGLLYCGLFNFWEIAAVGGAGPALSWLAMAQLLGGIFFLIAPLTSLAQKIINHFFEPTPQYLNGVYIPPKHR